jgi:hypothetical protein
VTPEEARRRLQQRAHRDADRQTQQVAQATGPQRIVATVTTVVAGGAPDGNDLISVTWRNGETLAAGWNAAQTFVVGQRVVCDLIDGQLIVDYPIVGQP